MIRISQIRLPVAYSRDDIRISICKKLRIPDTRLLDFMIVKQSLDARDKSDIHYSCTVDVRTDQEAQILRRNKNRNITEAPVHTYRFPACGEKPLLTRPVVIGSGPAGLFAAYFLAMKGFRPIVIERGEPAMQRVETVRHFWETGELDPESNAQFGEGGAGTFSDGKLHTGVRDPSGRNRLVLETFVEHGAPEEILYSNKPHLGTDLLVTIVTSMRRKIEAYGGEFRFRTCFREFIVQDGRVTGVVTSRGRVDADVVLLAIGHSARDTFSYLIRSTDLHITAKPFAVGIRAEHLQKDIDRSQYGDVPEGLLPPADYKLTFRSSRGNSVYSFCMCPGGYVVNASSLPGRLCVNGMSYSKRDSANANSAIVAAVHPSDDPARNIAFQEMLEQKAFQAGQGSIVSQRLEDFSMGRISDHFGRIQPVHKGSTVMGNIREILPEETCEDILEAMQAFGRKIRGFDDPDVILSAVESRTSSPIRIERDEHMESAIRGVYPIGEGAGYAGGITSAAIDGIRAFEKICSGFVLSDAIC